jgi:hypothetical protein
LGQQVDRLGVLQAQDLEQCSEAVCFAALER